MSTIVRQFLSLLSVKERTQLYFQFGLLVVMAVLDTVGVASILPFMAVVSKPDVISSNRWLNDVYVLLNMSSVQSFLFFLGMIVLGLLVLSNSMKGIFTWLTLRYDNQLNLSLAHRLLACYMARPYEYFLNANTADLGKNVLSESNAVIVGILSPGMQILSNGLVCLLIFVLLVAVDPFVAVAIVVVLGGAYGTVYALVRRRLAVIGKEQSSANARKFRTAGEALRGIKELKVLGQERTFLQRFAFYAERHARHNATVGTITQIPRYILETVAFGGILLIVLYSLKTDQEISKVVPLLSLYAFAGYRLMPALQQLFASFSALRVNLPALAILHDEIRGTAADASAILPETKRVLALPFTRDLVLEDLTFSYETAREAVVKGLSLTIRPYTSIGLVGPTGAGKTTIIDLILGLLIPASGRILVDGTEIRGENLARWQRNLGYVPQSIFLSDDTITRNIAFGVAEEDVDMEAVVRAAQIANLHDFVEEELPARYETVVGEIGMRLSGGQRQRIGIARALYRDPAVLIMDEGTSALDGITEGAVMDALRTLKGKKTVIMIAHRLTTVKDCDVICLMEDGRIAAQGTYQEMLKSSSWFKAAVQ